MERLVVPEPVVEYPPGATPVGPLESAAPVGAGSGPAALLRVGDSERSRFRYQGQWAMGSFDGVVFGLVEADLSAAAELDSGRCLVLLTQFTPTDVVGTVSAGRYDYPAIGLSVDGEILESELPRCETEAIDAAGFSWIQDVTPGTDGLSYEAFLVPDSVEPDAIVVGQPDQGDVLYYEPTMLDEIPSIKATIGPPLRGDALPAGDPGAAFTDVVPQRNVSWDGLVFGVYEVPTQSFIEENLRCALVVLSLTPYAYADDPLGSLVAPEVSLVANGRRLTDGERNCDTTEALEAGISPSLSADHTLGETSLVYDEWLLTDAEFETLDVIIIGSPYNGGALTYEASILDELPN